MSSGKVPIAAGSVPKMELCEISSNDKPLHPLKEGGNEPEKRLLASPRRTRDGASAGMVPSRLLLPTTMCLRVGIWRENREKACVAVRFG